MWAQRGPPTNVFGFAITRGKIVEVDLVADPERLRQLDMATSTDQPTYAPARVRTIMLTSSLMTSLSSVFSLGSRPFPPFVSSTGSQQARWFVRPLRAP